MPIFSAVGLFCFYSFEETPNEKVVNMSKITKPYFNNGIFKIGWSAGWTILREEYNQKHLPFL